MMISMIIYDDHLRRTPKKSLLFFFINFINGLWTPLPPPSSFYKIKCRIFWKTPDLKRYFHVHLYGKKAFRNIPNLQLNFLWMGLTPPPPSPRFMKFMIKTDIFLVLTQASSTKLPIQRGAMEKSHQSILKNRTYLRAISGWRWKFEDGHKNMSSWTSWYSGCVTWIDRRTPHIAADTQTTNQGRKVG